MVKTLDKCRNWVYGFKPPAFEKDCSKRRKILVWDNASGYHTAIPLGLVAQLGRAVGFY